MSKSGYVEDFYTRKEHNIELENLRNRLDESFEKMGHITGLSQEKIDNNKARTVAQISYKNLFFLIKSLYMCLLH